MDNACDTMPSLQEIEVRREAQTCTLIDLNSDYNFRCKPSLSTLKTSSSIVKGMSVPVFVAESGLAVIKESVLKVTLSIKAQITACLELVTRWIYKTIYTLEVFVLTRL